MTMRRSCMLVAFAAALGAPGVDANASAADCLGLRDNAQVAACANRFGPATSAPRPHAGAESKPASARAVSVAAADDLIAVPVVRAAPSAPLVEEAPRIVADRSVLRNTVLAGVAGGTLLVALALGLWRWSATLRKACRWCGAKIARSAHTCPHCLRAT